MIALNCFFGLAIENGHLNGQARPWLIAGIVLNLLPLGVFK